MNLSQIGVIFDVFQKGRAVANPAAWKKGQITATLLTPFLVALVEFARSLGYSVPIDSDQLIAIAGGVVAIVNIVLTITTSKTVGTASSNLPVERLPPNPESDSGSTTIERSERTRSDQGYERTSGSSNVFNNRDNAGG